MWSYRRHHSNGIKSFLRPRANSWLIVIHLGEKGKNLAMSLPAITLDQAKELADKEILNRAHVCSGQCGAWEEILDPDGKSQDLSLSATS
jgi:hypothetical protein